ncbi:MAG: transposase domain-containing protein [Candidatus Megaira endosymbiont of Carteria cerasiformis]|nr:transposase domain-containing protein [Candidatus Megaera polyxenophila]
MHRNFCFFGLLKFLKNTEKGAKASSIIFGILETCKANELNSYNFLRYLFAIIQKAQTRQDLGPILPYNIDPGFLNP